MKLSQAVKTESKYLSAGDLPEGAEVKLVIRSVRMEQLEGKGKEQPVLYFQGKEKGLVLNVTNSRRLVAAFGDRDLHEYVGQTILLYRDQTEFRGDVVDCLRLRAAPAVEPADPGELAF